MNKPINLSILLFVALFFHISSFGFTFSQEFISAVHPQTNGISDVRQLIAYDDYNSAIKLAEELLLNVDLTSLSPLALVNHMAAVNRALNLHTKAQNIEPEKAIEYLLSRLAKANEKYPSCSSWTWKNAISDIGFQLPLGSQWKFIDREYSKAYGKPISISGVDPEVSWQSFCRGYRKSRQLAPDSMAGNLASNQLVLGAIRDLTKSQPGSSIYRTSAGFIWRLEMATLSTEEKHQYLLDRLGKSKTREFLMTHAKIIEDKILTANEESIVAPFGTPMTRITDPKKAVLAYAEQLIEMLSDSSKSIFEVAAFAHQQLVHIHPYLDGNGRMARLMMNTILMQKGYEPRLFTNDECYTLATEQALSDHKAFASILARAACTKKEVQSQRDEL